MKAHLAIAGALALAGCGALSDPATRLASGLEDASGKLAAGDGASLSVDLSPTDHGRCEGAYTAQFDKVGAIIVWCKDARGNTVSSHDTTYHSRFVDTARTFILDKPAGARLRVELTRHSGRATIVDVT